VHPKGRALIGETPKAYFFLTIAVLLALGALAYALSRFRRRWILCHTRGIKLGVILLMLPFFGVQ
jgi:hypothetical protein